MRVATIRNVNFAVVVMMGLGGMWGCKLPFSKAKTDDGNVVITSGRYLYVSSGTCYAGGVGTNSPSNQVIKYDLLTGNKIRTVADYRTTSPGDSPIAISSLDSGSLVVSVENANARRIDEVRKNGGGITPFLFNSTAFPSALRGLSVTADGSFLVTRAAAVEKFTSFKTRYLNGANAYISAPAGSCSAMNTALTFTLELPNGNVVIGSAAATPNNKIASLNSLGYSVAGDCLSAKAAPTTTALPVAAVNAGTDTILVAYASAVAADNQIVAYQYVPSTSNLSTATVKTVMSNTSYVFGASAMVFDSVNNDLYVANSPSGGERIEKFKWNPTAQTLTRAASAPFIQSSELTCISSMLISDQ